MGNFFNPQEYRKARKVHRCTYCGEQIDAGDGYTYQTGVYEGRWYVSKFHGECFDDLCENDEGEYTPYSNERPGAT